MDANATTALPRSPIRMKLIVGLFFAALGIVLTADNLDLLDAGPILLWWPVVLIAAGLTKLAERTGRGLALILLIVGTSCLAFNLGILRFSIFDLWPLILICGGFFMVARAFRGPGPSAEVQRANTVSSNAIFATRQLSSASKNFVGGDLFAFMSACQIDLTQADISGGPAVIDATAIWSGIEITVPEHWEVIGEVTPVMGGFELHPGNPVDSKRQLIVRGVALMGGIEVKTRRTA